MRSLNHIRHTPPSAEELQNHLGGCFQPALKAIEIATRQSVLQCTHLDDAIAINQKLVAQFFPDTLVEVDMLTNAEGVPELQTWLYNKCIHRLTHVAIGAHVMLTKNVDVRLGAANGATGTVVKLKYRGNHLTRIDVQLSNTTVVRVFWTRYRDTHLNCVKYHASTFPVCLAYAMTAHKCQGATIRGDIILYVRQAFSPGLLYVMLSSLVRKSRSLGQSRPLTSYLSHPSTSDSAPCMYLQETSDHQ